MQHTIINKNNKVLGKTAILEKRKRKKKIESSALVFFETTQHHSSSYKVKYIYKGIDQSQLSESGELSLRFLPTPLGEPSVQEMMTSFF